MRREAEARSSELLEEAADALATTGWNVHRAETMEDVGDLIARICQDIGADKALRSGHEVLDEAGIGSALDRVGVELKDMTLRDEVTDDERDEQRLAHRQEVFKTDVGITGGDYVIAETGTLVIHPKKGGVAVDLAGATSSHRGHETRAGTPIIGRAVLVGTRRHS